MHRSRTIWCRNGRKPKIQLISDTYIHTHKYIHTRTHVQVADDLVQEWKKAEDTASFDEKNIRRRVYDALNVLMAIDIITRDKKWIRCVLPIYIYMCVCVCV